MAKLLRYFINNFTHFGRLTAGEKKHTIILKVDFNIMKIFLFQLKEGYTLPPVLDIKKYILSSSQRKDLGKKESKSMRPLAKVKRNQVSGRYFYENNERFTARNLVSVLNLLRAL